MNLNDLKAAGAFVAPEPIKETVTWSGNTFDVWIKRPSFAESEKIIATMASGNHARGALMLANSVLLGEEKEPLPYEDALRLDPSLAMALVEAVQRVADRPKALAPKTKSGTS